MMPNTRVSPAATRNSITPSCSPLSSCSTTRRPVIGRGPESNERGAGSPRPCRGALACALPLHRTLVEVRVLVVLEDRLLDLHLHLPAGPLRRLEEVEVLDRVVVHVVGERAAGGAKVGLAHGGDHALLVGEIPLHRPH